MAKKNYNYFNGYLYNDHKGGALYMMLPKTNAYAKRYDGQTKWKYFLIVDLDLLEKYINWDKVSSDIKKNLIASLSVIKIF